MRTTIYTRFVEEKIKIIIYTTHIKYTYVLLLRFRSIRFDESTPHIIVKCIISSSPKTMSVEREFNLCVLGCGDVGKTSILRTLSGIPFSRKAKCPPADENEATQYSIEVNTSSGLILLNLYDWNWEVQKRDRNINGQLMKVFFTLELKPCNFDSQGRDGAVFVYDITHRRSKDDFVTQMGWYEMAAGFDKPVIIVSNKNDQKKKSIRDEEGQAMADHGNNRAFVPISLVDETGLDDLVLAITRVMTGDLGLSYASESNKYCTASEASLAWSAERNSTAGLGMNLDDMPNEKTKRVLLCVLNSSVAEKFIENSSSSEYAIETYGSVGMCAEEFENPSEGATALPIAGILVPPTASDSQKRSLTELAESHGLKLTVSIPKTCVEKLRENGA